MHILYTFWWYPYCWWHPIEIWSYKTLKSTMFVQYHSMCKTESPVSPTVVMGVSPKWCTFSDNIQWHIVEIWSHPAQKPCVSVLMKVNISEDSDGTYTKDAHSMCFLMIPIHSGVFGAWYSSIANNVKVILYRWFHFDGDTPLLLMHAFSTSND